MWRVLASLMFYYAKQKKQRVSLMPSNSFSSFDLSIGKCQDQRRQWHPTPVLLPGKFHGWRSLVGYSPWDRYELDLTEHLHFHFSLPCIGEGNGNPLQYSCPENPRDGGSWWAAVYGVAQSQTRLKRHSSSSSSSRIGTITNFRYFRSLVQLWECLNQATRESASKVGSLKSSTFGRKDLAQVPLLCSVLSWNSQGKHDLGVSVTARSKVQQSAVINRAHKSASLEGTCPRPPH